MVVTDGITCIDFPVFPAWRPPLPIPSEENPDPIQPDRYLFSWLVEKAVSETVCTISVSSSACAAFPFSQHNGYMESDVYHPLILFWWFLSLPLAAGRLLSLQFLREGPQNAHKVLIPVSWSYTPKITLKKFTERTKMRANFLHIP